ncbi:MAG: LysR family transcriptional regulator [Halofilum sp. (in: g-proteobacteria)]|nr:LysR family transcriptional regulator [Halofilum sp. (in: g-proteobacteria)]
MAERGPRTTLDQWRVLQAIVDHGGFEAAAEALSRSQSSVSYAVRQLEERLPLALFARDGRRAELTDAGAALLRRARALVAEAHALEHYAATLAAGWEAEVTLAADLISPPSFLMPALAAFSESAPQTRVRVLEEVLTGTTDAIVDRAADVALIGNMAPPGFLGEPLLDVEFVAVAHPEHPLNRLDRPVTDSDLRTQRQIVVRDTGRQGRDSGWLGAEQRWTVSHVRTSVAALEQGMGFAWVPRDVAAEALAAGRLAPLPLETGGTRRVTLNLVLVDRDGAGPAARALAAELRASAARFTRAHAGGQRA